MAELDTKSDQDRRDDAGSTTVSGAGVGWTWVEEDLPSAEEEKWSTHSAAQARELRVLAASVRAKLLKA